MAKKTKRFNSKKIASQPLLKKRMAQLCARVDATWGEARDKTIDLEDILTYGHRGYISLHEDDLAKVFDRKLQFLKAHHEKYKEAEEKHKQDRRWYQPSKAFEDLTLWYEEGIEIADEVFEEKFLR